jgi:hypothetical protein
MSWWTDKSIQSSYELFRREAAKRQASMHSSNTWSDDRIKKWQEVQGFTVRRADASPWGND